MQITKTGRPFVFMVSFLFSLLGNSVCAKQECANNQLHNFKDRSAAQKYYSGVLGSKHAKWEGRTTSFGSSFQSFTSTRTDWINAYTGERVYSEFSWSQYSCTSCGSVLAIPEKNFRVEEIFSFGERSTLSTGIVVSVGAEVKGGGGKISDVVKNNTIKNLAFSGMAIRGDNSNPGGRILSLKRSSKERFGASQNEITSIP